LVKKYENVYLEPGALGARKAEDVLPQYLSIIKENNLIDRVIYGSDGPQFPGYTKSHLNRFGDAMQEVNYTNKEMELLLGKNFESLFGL
jgi:predicted TIM-barrel fold metal-dependent hydrolase